MTASSTMTRIELRGALSCLLCARVIAHACGPRLAVLRVLNPEHTPMVRQMRCPYCSGRLLVSDIDEVYVVDRRPLPDEPVVPRGRPTKAQSARRIAATLCMVCDRRPAKWGRRKCRPCASQRAVAS